MAHWFDRLSDRSVRDEQALSRRAVLRAGGAGLIAGSALSSPSLAAASERAADLLRESACKCHENADRRYEKAMKSYADEVSKRGSFLSFVGVGIDFFALGGLEGGYMARKLSCGTCKRSPSGDNEPAPPNYVIPAGPVPGVPGGFVCPDGTFRCSLASTTCCANGDLCCPSQGDFQCCIVAVGCACAP